MLLDYLEGSSPTPETDTVDGERGSGFKQLLGVVAGMAPYVGTVMSVASLYPWLFGTAGDTEYSALAGTTDFGPRDPNATDTVSLPWHTKMSFHPEFERTVVAVVPLQFPASSDDPVEFVAAAEWVTPEGAKDRQFHGEFGTSFAIGPSVDDVGSPETPRVTGQIRQPDGSPDVDHTLAMLSDGSVVTMVTTDEEGRFSYRVANGREHDVQYYQIHDTNTDNDRFDPEGPIGPRDGTPDMFAVTRLTPRTSRDLGTVRLPEAHLLDVRVVDQEGDPIEGAEVAIEHVNDEADAGLTAFPTDRDGYFVWGASDETGLELHGDVRVEVRPPNDDEFEATETVRELTVSDPTEITVTLERTGGAEGNVTGRILQHDGAPAAKHTLVVYRVADKELVEWATTDEEGYFAYSVDTDERYDIQYYQVYDTDTDNDRFDPGGPRGPRDGVPDVFALVQHRGAGALGTLELPEAYPLDVRVVDGDDDPIQHARVTIEHYSADDDADAGLGPRLTNRNGYFVWGTDETGLEVRGDITVVVQPPEDSENYEDAETERDLQVTEPTTVEVTLDQIDP